MNNNINNIMATFYILGALVLIILLLMAIYSKK